MYIIESEICHSIFLYSDCANELIQMLILGKIPKNYILLYWVPRLKYKSGEAMLLIAYNLGLPSIPPANPTL